MSKNLLPEKQKNIFNSQNEFQFGARIGKGAFSEVFIATHKKSGNIYAIKKIDISLLNIRDYPNIIREILIHLKLKHPNIVYLYDYFQEDGILYLV